MDLSSSHLPATAGRVAFCCNLLAAISLNTMANETTAPNAADYLKREELAIAEAKALTAEKALIEAQLELEEAKKKLNLTPSDAKTQAMAAAKVAKEVAEAEKALAEARIANFKAKYGGVPDSGIAGDVTLGGKAGELEMTLLAHRALVDAAKTVSEVVRTKLTAPSARSPNLESDNTANPPLTLYLYPADQLPNFQTVANFTVQRNAVKEALKQATDAANAADDALKTKGFGPAVTPATVGVAVESITKLLGFFRSDYSIGGSQIALDDIALIQAVASHDLPGHTIVPVLYYPQAVRGAATLVTTELKELSAQQTQAKVLADKLERLISETQKNAAAARTPGAAIDGEVDGLRPLVDRLKAAAGAYDTLLSRLMAPDEATGAMLRDLAVWNGLNQSGGHLLLLKVQRAGGSSYTKKSLWSFFGTMPYYVAGGTVVSYTLLRGQDGTVLASGLLPVHGGFESAKRVPALLPARR